MSGAGIVIVGGGQAGTQVAISLREGGYTGPVTIVSEESGLPYQRPPLSKAFLLEKADETSIRIRQPKFYHDHRIDIHEGRKVVEIDRDRKRVRLAGGGEIEYTHLVLATGARNRSLPVPGSDLNGVFHLRSLKDACQLRARLAASRDVVIIGAGFIGLEFAAVAAQRATRVSIVEATDRCMSRAVSPEAASYFERQHRRRGVVFKFKEAVDRINGTDGMVDSVETANGTRLKADLVLVATGVIPNTELAAAASLPVQNGVLVNEHLTTADPSVFAIGDCAAYPNGFANAIVRLESVQNAVDQAKTVATTIVGQAAPFRAVPWFWSDQSDDRLQIAGIAYPSDSRVVVGDETLGRFSVLCFRDDRLTAVESVNRTSDHVAARKLLQSGRRFCLANVAPNLDLRAVANTCR